MSVATGMRAGIELGYHALAVSSFVVTTACDFAVP